jgi:hypothetical protein
MWQPFGERTGTETVTESANTNGLHTFAVVPYPKMIPKLYSFPYLNDFI